MEVVSTTSEFNSFPSENDYLSIAIGDVLDIECLMNNNRYARIPARCSEAIEKLLKSQLEKELNAPRGLIRSHDILAICRYMESVHKEYAKIHYSVANVNGYYFSNRYPCESFMNGDIESATEAYNNLMEVFRFVTEVDNSFK